MDLEAGFWQAYARFLKTPLLTEEPNPFTADLSELAQTNLTEAYKRLQELDLATMAVIANRQVELEQYRTKLAKIRNQAGRIILVGCGASGRVAEQVAYWARLNKKWGNIVIPVLAGGDVTLIEAIESCEDSPEFARRQMAELNLTEYDYVIGLSASGESPFILTALHFAQTKTKAKPVLICTNPIATLMERDLTHLAGDSHFDIVSLVVGAMALTGSTRMQATTAMTLFLLLTLLPEKFNLQTVQRFYAQLDYVGLCPFTEWEAKQNQQQQKVVYVTSSDLALPVLSDLTERAPTFNLPRLYHVTDLSDLSGLGITLSDTHDSKDAWKKLLGRLPQALDFQDVAKTSLDYLLGFDLSQSGSGATLSITLKKGILQWQTDSGLVWNLDVSALNFFEIQFLLRLILVNHSTLVMGRLHFYTGNLMTSVKPANYKLIDRAVRYIQFLYAQKTGKALDYQQTVKMVFTILPNLKPQESIVFRTLEVIEQQSS